MRRRAREGARVFVGGRAPGRESDGEIILYIALGIWGEYAAILPHVYRRAKELGLGRGQGGQTVELVDGNLTEQQLVPS